MTLFVNFYTTHTHNTWGEWVDQGDFGSDPSKQHMGTDTLHLYAPAPNTEIISNSSSINPMI